MKKPKKENLNDFEFIILEKDKKNPDNNFIEKKGVMSAYFTPSEIKEEINALKKQYKDDQGVKLFSKSLIDAFKKKYKELYEMVKDLEGENLRALAQFLNAKTTIAKIEKSEKLSELEIKGREELLSFLKEKGIIKE